MGSYAVGAAWRAPLSRARAPKSWRARRVLVRAVRPGAGAPRAAPLFTSSPHPDADGDDPPRQLRLHLQPQLPGRARGELEVRRLARAREEVGRALAPLR